MKRYGLTLIALFMVQSFAIAQAQGEPSGTESLEPEVVITPGEGDWVREYRVNGQLYMIEIIPEKGFPYFLVDMDGDGLLETRRNNVETDILIPRWTLLRW